MHNVAKGFCFVLFLFLFLFFVVSTVTFAPTSAKPCTQMSYIFFLINCWSSVVASVVLPTVVAISTFFG